MLTTTHTFDAITTMATIQDVLSHNQNWTILGILGAVIMGIVGLLVWLVKWLCTRFAGAVDQCSKAITDSSAANAQVVVELRAITSSTLALREHIDHIPNRTADVIQNRKIL